MTFTSTLGWVTALDLDFTQQSSQTLTTDGNYTIAGLTFKKENSSGDQSPLTLTSGTGLIITPTSAPNYNASTRTSPLVWCQMSQFLPANVDWSTNLRIYAYFSNLANIVNQFDTAYAGFDTDSMLYSMVAGEGINAGNHQIFVNSTINGSVIGSSVTVSSFGTSNNVVMMEMPGIASIAAVKGYYGQYNSGFPTLANMHLACVQSVGSLSGAFLDPISGTTGTKTPGQALGIVLTAVRPTSADAFSVTIARIRVDYKLG